MWRSFVITNNGKVVPCCFDKEAKYVLGDLNENSISEIWFGDKYNEFRRTVLSGRRKIDICRNCTEGLQI